MSASRIWRRPRLCRRLSFWIIVFSACDELSLIFISWSWCQWHETMATSQSILLLVLALVSLALGISSFYSPNQASSIIIFLPKIMISRAFCVSKTIPEIHVIQFFRPSPFLTLFPSLASLLISTSSYSILCFYFWYSLRYPFLWNPFLWRSGWMRESSALALFWLFSFSAHIDLFFFNFVFCFLYLYIHWEMDFL